MCNMKALSLLVRMLWPMLKFLFMHTRRRRHGRRRGHQGYDISSPDIRSGSLKYVYTKITLFKKYKQIYITLQTELSSLVFYKAYLNQFI